MSFKELFHINKKRQEIKLDKSDLGFIIFREDEKEPEQKWNIEKYSNEWNQEYEVIYSSYILEK